MAFQSSVPQKKLGAELRRARRGLRLSTYAAGSIVGVSQSTMSRIESGKTTLTPQALAKLARAYKVDKDVQAGWQQLLEEGRTGDEWWTALGWALPKAYIELIEHENEADRLTTINTLVIPGLLQTQNYSATLMRNPLMLPDPDHVDAHLEARTRRKQRLDDDDPLTLYALVPEAVLGYRYGGDDAVWQEQLRHLRTMCDHPRVTFRIIPNAHMVTLYAIDLYEFPQGDPPVAYSESGSTTVFERNLDVRRFQRMVSWVEQAASSPEETAKMIEERIKEQ